MVVDRKKFLAAFNSEAQELITHLDSGLVKLEGDPGDLELLDEICRAAHTLKGSSRMMGFNQISDVAHGMEDILFKLKEEELRFHPGIADSIFAALDVVKVAIARVLDGGSEDVDVDDIRSKMVDACNGSSGKAPPTREVSPSPKKDLDEKKSVVGDDYIRVPISRINRLLNLIGEMVINKVKSTYRVSQVKRLSRRSRNFEKMLSETKTLVKDALDIPDELIHSGGKMLRASKKFESATELLDHLHNMEALYDKLNSDIVDLSDDIRSEVFQLGPVIEELQQKMKEIRMLPCSTLFEGYPRLVRDIARECDKPVRLVVEGGETELDKKVIEAIGGPLIHMLRNAVDHGIESKEKRLSSGKDETATITLSAFQEGGGVVIVVSDDGAGIDLNDVREKALSKGVVSKVALEEMEDLEILNLIFAKGFSTSEFITDISGRGVGLDVVRNEIEILKGSVDIKSEKGVGTSVRLELPLTIAVMRALIVRSSGVRWAFQMSNLEGSLTVSPEEISTIENRMVIQIQGRSVPIVPLSDILGVVGSQDKLVDSNGGRGEAEKIVVVIVNSLDRKVGFIVDKIEGEDEIFIKSIGSHLGKVDGVSGATILPSGEVLVVLDAHNLMRRANLAHPAAMNKREVLKVQKGKRVLIVEDSMTTRELERTILESSGFEVETAIDGLDAMEKLSDSSFDAIITDINMPRMDGFELCRNVRLNERYKDLPIVFVTACSKDEEKRKGIELGAQAYITKGQFDQENLLETLDRLI